MWTMATFIQQWKYWRLEHKFHAVYSSSSLEHQGHLLGRNLTLEATAIDMFRTLINFDGAFVTNRAQLTSSPLATWARCFPVSLFLNKKRFLRLPTARIAMFKVGRKVLVCLKFGQFAGVA